MGSSWRTDRDAELCASERVGARFTGSVYVNSITTVEVQRTEAKALKGSCKLEYEV